MARRMKDPAKSAAKWRRNLQAAAQDMQDGVAAVTEAPGQAAAKKEATMKARLLAALDSGKWRRNVAAVTLSDWQQSMTQKGIARAVDGAAQGEAKVQNTLAILQPKIEALRAQIDQMPNASAADRKARMNAWFDGMSKISASR